MLDLKQVELVYGSSFFKSIETGGNVSKALVQRHLVHLEYYIHLYSISVAVSSCSQLVASTHACYSSVLTFQNKLYLLGLKVRTKNKV